MREQVRRLSTSLGLPVGGSTRGGGGGVHQSQIREEAVQMECTDEKSEESIFTAL